MLKCSLNNLETAVKAAVDLILPFVKEFSYVEIQFDFVKLIRPDSILQNS